MILRFGDNQTTFQFDGETKLSELLAVPGVRELRPDLGKRMPSIGEALDTAGLKFWLGSFEVDVDFGVEPGDAIEATYSRERAS